MSRGTGRAALVTGGAKRIGEAIVRRLAAEGYAVAVHCRGSRVEAEALAASLPHGGAVVEGDLADVGCARIVEEAVAALGRLSLLVNNASLFAVDALADLDPARFDSHMAINLRAPALLSRRFAEQAEPSDDPSIVHIVDQRVRKLTPQAFSYTLSKAGLAAATVTMAQALAPRIRVNGVGPGPTAANPTTARQAWRKRPPARPWGRAVSPDDIAEAVAYLAKARSVTGRSLRWTAASRWAGARRTSWSRWGMRGKSPTRQPLRGCHPPPPGEGKRFIFQRFELVAASCLQRDSRDQPSIVGFALVNRAAVAEEAGGVGIGAQAEVLEVPDIGLREAVADIGGEIE